MKNLHTYMTNDGDELASPNDSSAHTLQTPAMELIHDFKKFHPMAIDSSTSADELKSLMLRLHIRLISVVDSHAHFIGIVSLEDLSDQNLIRKQAEGFSRSDIRAADFMTRRKDLLAFDREEIEDASIGDVVESLKQHARKECLVVDRHSHEICGIFAISEISQKLRQPIEIHDQSNFYRVFAPASYNSHPHGK